MTDNMSIWIDGTPYDWDQLVRIVRKSKGRREPEVEMAYANVAYRIRWEDGETWKVSINENSDGPAFFVYDPQGRLLSETDPMHGELMEVVKRHHKPPYGADSYGVIQ